MKNEIKIFSPATVANVACGFDVLGFCLDNKGDEMVIRKAQWGHQYLCDLSYGCGVQNSYISF